MDIGSRVKNLRTQIKLTQDELAKALNVSRSTIAMVERNERQPGYDLLNSIADFFNVTTDYLLGRSEYKKGRILTKDEMRTFLPKEVAEIPDLLITVDDKEQQLSDDTKKEIIEVLKKNGYIK